MLRCSQSALPLTHCEANPAPLGRSADLTLSAWDERDKQVSVWSQSWEVTTHLSSAAFFFLNSSLSLLKAKPLNSRRFFLISVFYMWRNTTLLTRARPPYKPLTVPGRSKQSLCRGFRSTASCLEIKCSTAGREEARVITSRYLARANDDIIIMMMSSCALVPSYRCTWYYISIKSVHTNKTGTYYYLISGYLNITKTDQIILMSLIPTSREDLTSCNIPQLSPWTSFILQWGFQQLYITWQACHTQLLN